MVFDYCINNYLIFDFIYELCNMDFGIKGYNLVV